MEPTISALIVLAGHNPFLVAILPTEVEFVSLSEAFPNETILLPDASILDEVKGSASHRAESDRIWFEGQSGPATTGGLQTIEDVPQSRCHVRGVSRLMKKPGVLHLARSFLVIKSGASSGS